MKATYPPERLNPWKSPRAELYASGRIDPNVTNYRKFVDLARKQGISAHHSPITNDTIRYLLEKEFEEPYAFDMNQRDSIASYKATVDNLAQKQWIRRARHQTLPAVPLDTRIITRFYDEHLHSKLAKKALFGREDTWGRLTPIRGTKPAVKFKPSKPGYHRFDGHTPSEIDLTLPYGWVKMLDGMPPVIRFNIDAKQEYAFVVYQEPHESFYNELLRNNGMDPVIRLANCQVVIRRREGRVISPMLLRLYCPTVCHELGDLVMSPHAPSLVERLNHAWRNALEVFKHRLLR